LLNKTKGINTPKTIRSMSRWKTMEKAIEKESENQVARCPYCGNELTHLLVYGAKIQLYNVTLSEDGELSYEFIDESDSLENEEFYCPNCGRLLTKDINEAKKILRGGKQWAVRRYT
jgi:predicted RNA-binding Zn-ribbon protein involved in translation (DUF1610 family)